MERLSVSTLGNPLMWRDEVSSRLVRQLDDDGIGSLT
jgi:hypothetical protein